MNVDNRVNMNLPTLLAKCARRMWHPAIATSEAKKKLLKRKDFDDFSEKMRYSLFNRIRDTT